MIVSRTLLASSGGGAAGVTEALIKRRTPHQIDRIRVRPTRRRSHALHSTDSEQRDADR